MKIINETESPILILGVSIDGSGYDVPLNEIVSFAKDAKLRAFVIQGFFSIETFGLKMFSAQAIQWLSQVSDGTIVYSGG